MFGIYLHAREVASDSLFTCVTGSDRDVNGGRGVVWDDSFMNRLEVIW